MANRKMSDTTEGMEFLNDIKFTVTHALFKKGTDLPTADSVAEALKQKIYTRFQGSLMYLPNARGMAGVSSSRDQVLALYDEGKKVREIIRLTGLSDSRVYSHIRNRNKPLKEPKAPKLTGMKDLQAIKLDTARVLLNNGIDAALCRDIADQLQTFLCKHWGGITFYIGTVAKVKTKANPEGELVTRGKRADFVFLDHTGGMGVVALAEKYGLSQSHIRHLLRIKAQPCASLSGAYEEH